MTEAPHHLPLKHLAQRLEQGESVDVLEIKATLDDYMIAMASFSLIDVETWFQNILSQMAPICLQKPEAEDVALNVLLTSWHQMGVDTFSAVMDSVKYMHERSFKNNFEPSRKEWLEQLMSKPELISRLVKNHPSYQSSEMR